MSTVWICLSLFGVSLGLYAATTTLLQIRALLRNRDVDHAKCIAHVSHYTGNQFAATVLRQTADDYLSARGQLEMRMLANSRDIADVPIPAVWLRQRADGLADEVTP